MCVSANYRYVNILRFFMLHFVIFSFKCCHNTVLTVELGLAIKTTLLWFIKDLLHAYIVETLSQTLIFLQRLMSKQCLNLFNRRTHITNYCFLLCVDFL